MTHGSLSLDYIYVFVVITGSYLLLSVLIVVCDSDHCHYHGHCQMNHRWRDLRGGGCKQCILWRWDLMCSKVGSQQRDRFKYTSTVYHIYIYIHNIYIYMNNKYMRCGQNKRRLLQ